MQSQLYDLSQMYHPSNSIQLQQPIPSEAEAELMLLFDKARKLSLVEYFGWMQQYFRKFIEVNPNGPIELLRQWGSVPVGKGARSAMRLWLGELLSLAYSDALPAEIKRRAENALGDQDIWDSACSIGRHAFRGKSQSKIDKLLRDWLSDHVAVQIWGGLWLHAITYPETRRHRPYQYECRKKDTLASWDTMTPVEAVRNAQLERIFGEGVRQAIPQYNADHPLSVAVKRESPQRDDKWGRTMFMLLALVPMIRHHGWQTANILHCVLELHPDLRDRFDLKDPIARAKGCRYIHRRLLDQIGIACNDTPGRPVGNNPRAFAVAHIVVNQFK